MEVHLADLSAGAAVFIHISTAKTVLSKVDFFMGGFMVIIDIRVAFFTNRTGSAEGNTIFAAFAQQGVLFFPFMGSFIVYPVCTENFLAVYQIDLQGTVGDHAAFALYRLRAADATPLRTASRADFQNAAVFLGLIILKLASLIDPPDLSFCFLTAGASAGQKLYITAQTDVRKDLPVRRIGIMSVTLSAAALGLAAGQAGLLEPISGNAGGGAVPQSKFIHPAVVILVSHTVEVQQLLSVTAEAMDLIDPGLTLRDRHFRGRNHPFCATVSADTPSVFLITPLAVCKDLAVHFLATDTAFYIAPAAAQTVLIKLCFLVDHHLVVINFFCMCFAAVFTGIGNDNAVLAAITQHLPLHVIVVRSVVAPGIAGGNGLSGSVLISDVLCVYDLTVFILLILLHDRVSGSTANRALLDDSCFLIAYSLPLTLSALKPVSCLLAAGAFCLNKRGSAKSGTGQILVGLKDHRMVVFPIFFLCCTAINAGEPDPNAFLAAAAQQFIVGKLRIVACVDIDLVVAIEQLAGLIIIRISIAGGTQTVFSLDGLLCILANRATLGACPYTVTVFPLAVFFCLVAISLAAGTGSVG